MDTRDAATELPQRIALNLESQISTSIDRTLARIKPYREFIVLVAAICGAALALHEYFITRLEVRILNCRSLAQIQLLEGRMEMESLKPQVARALLTQPPNFTKASISNLTLEQDIAAEEYLQFQSILKRNAAASTAIEEARVRLKPGKCEALVKDDKDL